MFSPNSSFSPKSQFQVGAIGSPLYSLSIAIYFLCTIVYDIKQAAFRERFERYLHMFPSLFPLCAAVFLVSTGSFNTAGYGCWIAAYPEGCTHDPDVDCIRG